MADQYHEGGGLHLKGDHSQSESGYGQSSYSTGSVYGEPQSDSYQSEQSYGNAAYSNPGYQDAVYGAAYQSTQNVFDEPYQTTYTGNVAAAGQAASVMTGAFMYMFIALLVTGITGVITASSPLLLSIIFSSEISFVLILVSEFAIVWGATAAMRKNNVVLSGVLFFAYAVVNGLTFSVIFLAYTASSIEQAFFSTAVVFGLMAVIGKVTNKDLSSLGSILLVGLLGVILTSVVNLFLGSSTLDIGISVVTIFIFLGLTAYDTQKIQKMAQANSGYNPAVISLWGAMELYLDFVNLFLRIIRLMGRRK